MRDSTQAFAMFGTGPEKLTADEISTLFDYCYAIHDHQATRPQEPLFWWRIPRVGTSKYGAN